MVDIKGHLAASFWDFLDGEISEEDWQSFLATAFQDGFLAEKELSLIEKIAEQEGTGNYTNLETEISPRIRQQAKALLKSKIQTFKQYQDKWHKNPSWKLMGFTKPDDLVSHESRDEAYSVSLDSIQYDRSNFDAEIQLTMTKGMESREYQISIYGFNALRFAGVDDLPAPDLNSWFVSAFLLRPALSEAFYNSSDETYREKLRDLQEGQSEMFSIDIHSDHSDFEKISWEFAEILGDDVDGGQSYDEYTVNLGPASLTVLLPKNDISDEDRDHMLDLVLNSFKDLPEEVVQSFCNELDALVLYRTEDYYEEFYEKHPDLGLREFPGGFADPGEGTSRAYANISVLNDEEIIGTLHHEVIGHVFAYANMPHYFAGLGLAQHFMSQKLFMLANSMSVESRFLSNYSAASIQEFVAEALAAYYSGGTLLNGTTGTRQELMKEDDDLYLMCLMFDVLLQEKHSGRGETEPAMAFSLTALELIDDVLREERRPDFEDPDFISRFREKVLETDFSAEGDFLRITHQIENGEVDLEDEATLKKLTDAFQKLKPKSAIRIGAMVTHSLTSSELASSEEMKKYWLVLLKEYPFSLTAYGSYEKFIFNDESLINPDIEFLEKALDAFHHGRYGYRTLMESFVLDHELSIAKIKAEGPNALWSLKQFIESSLDYWAHCDYSEDPKGEFINGKTVPLKDRLKGPMARTLLIRLAQVKYLTGDKDWKKPLRLMLRLHKQDPEADQSYFPIDISKADLESLISLDPKFFSALSPHKP